NAGGVRHRVRPRAAGQRRWNGDRRRRDLQASDRDADEGAGGMKPSWTTGAVLAAARSAGQAQPPSAESILSKVDENQVAGSRITVYEMTIHGRRGSRTIKAKSSVEGVDRAFTEYLEPPREAGTKMLK